MSDCPHRHDLGAYVLDGLEPEEADRVARHLQACGACRAEHAELADTPELLALAGHAPPEAPRRIRDALIARTARQRARRRWTWAAAGAACVAALVGGVVGWQLGPDPVPRTGVPLEAAEPYEARGWAWFDPGPEGLEVRLELEGLEPLKDPRVYEAWLSTTDDRVVSIGQLPSGRDDAEVELTARGSLEDYEGLWITAEPDARDPAHDGPTVVRATLPGD